MEGKGTVSSEKLQVTVHWFPL